MEGNKMDQKIIEKLQKLLALSASDNEHEAALAMSKAEALMREHNLSVADVAINGSGANVESNEVCGLTKAYQSWEGQLGVSIAKAFNGRAIRGRYYDSWKLTFVAGITDLSIITDLFERLRQTIGRMSREYAKNNYSADVFCVSRETFKKSYRMGLLNTLFNRLKKFKENTAPDNTARNSCGLTGMELMVVKDKAVSEKLHQMFPNLKPGRKGRAARVNMTAYQQGQADGHNVSLHRSVGGSDAPMAIAR
ncbi:MAG: DUF2786 domain-containing protein [Puia sp.]|nr:DUF2786 domain-containing protein [Puia sp.]